MKVGDFVRDKRVRDVGFVSSIGEDGMIEVRWNDGVLWVEFNSLELATEKEWGRGGMVDTGDLKSPTRKSVRVRLPPTPPNFMEKK